MPDQTRIVSPGKTERSVTTTDGEHLVAPRDWELLPPGDAGVTRRVKSRGPTWTVKQKKGRRTFSLGVWAPAERIAAVKAEFETERGTEAYAKRKASDAKRREKKQTAYVDDFHQAVVDFLNFNPCYGDMAIQLATVVTQHATPVGSGTVARTQRIPINRRAESAVIAWMRHQTTAYDHMKIARIKGRRREVRRELAQQSKKLLAKYRSGQAVELENCPLAKALKTP